MTEHEASIFVDSYGDIIIVCSCGEIIVDSVDTVTGRIVKRGRPIPLPEMLEPLERHLRSEGVYDPLTS